MRKNLLVVLAVVTVIAALGLTAHLLDFAGLAARVHGR
jgi:hypothetical protein